MSNIQNLQREHAEWMEHNFPTRQPYYHVLGLMGELGELAQAMLKVKEGTGEIGDHHETILDAIGDMAIFLVGLSTDLDMDFEDLLMATWAEVSQRDWKAYPINGRTR